MEQQTTPPHDVTVNLSMLTLALSTQFCIYRKIFECKEVVLHCIRPGHNMTQEPASYCIALCCIATSYCEPANRDAMQHKTTQRKNRLKFYFCFACVNCIQPIRFQEKTCESTEGVILSLKALSTNFCACRRPTFGSLPIASWLQSYKAFKA